MRTSISGPFTRRRTGRRGWVPAPVLTMIPARRGGFWIGGRQGVARYHDGDTEWLEPKATARLLDVKAILEQDDGTLWVSCDGEGLGQVRNGRIRQYLRKDGLGSDFTKSLLLDQDGALWIGTRGGGLNRFKQGRFSVIGMANGLADDTVSQIEDDGVGNLWMSTRRGIIRVSKEELNACADGRRDQVRCLTYGLDDGLNTLTCSSSQQFPGCRTPDGHLVFSMDRGVAEIDPKLARLNSLPPPVEIQNVRIADKLVTDGITAPGALTVGPGPNRLEIEYTGLSFASPDRVRFKHRLEPIDPDWIEVGTDRRAVYNYLPPGRYVFHVTAANNDNVWNPTGAQLDIEVRPYFWQTLWFRLLALASLLAVTGGVVWIQARYKLLRSLEALKLERAVDAERSRIAHDMHDDLGAHLTRIAMLSETARSDLDDRPKTEDSLGRIYEATRSITRAMDEIVWAINPRHDTIESLISYCEKTAQDLLGAAGIACRLDFPLELPDWTPTSEVRHNLFLAYKEALNNAVRHAGATVVSVSLQLTADVCRITIADNGSGIDRDEARGPTDPGRIASGNGLPSMQRRLARIGGACEIESSPGRGCAVRLTVPVEAFQSRNVHGRN
jgi:signal transduction histidine kinase